MIPNLHLEKKLRLITQKQLIYKEKFPSVLTKYKKTAAAPVQMIARLGAAQLSELLVQ